MTPMLPHGTPSYNGIKGRAPIRLYSPLPKAGPFLALHANDNPEPDEETAEDTHVRQDTSGKYGSIQCGTLSLGDYGSTAPPQASFEKHMHIDRKNTPIKAAKPGERWTVNATSTALTKRAEEEDINGLCRSFQSKAAIRVPIKDATNQPSALTGLAAGALRPSLPAECMATSAVKPSREVMRLADAQSQRPTYNALPLTPSLPYSLSQTSLQAPHHTALQQWQQRAIAAAPVLHLGYADTDCASGDAGVHAAAHCQPSAAVAEGQTLHAATHTDGRANDAKDVAVQQPRSPGSSGADGACMPDDATGRKLAAAGHSTTTSCMPQETYPLRVECAQQGWQQQVVSAAHTQLGSVHMLTPVKASKALQQSLGACDMVLTPVRRSARKVPMGSTQPVGELLQATGYHYAPNETLL